MGKLKAVIFDLDGTLLDNNEYHLKAWKKYLHDEQIEISDEDFKKNISGRTNRDAVNHIFKKELSEEESSKYYLKKEEIYREMYAGDIAPIKGLPEFLKELAENDIPIALATSGIQVNIDFMFEHVDVKKYFREIVKAQDITNGKPDPEIFLKTAEKLGISPRNCIVFEDSLPGVEAGKAAGMKVVALTTSLPAEELEIADLVIDDYSKIRYQQLLAMM